MENEPYVKKKLERNRKRKGREGKKERKGCCKIGERKW